MKKYTVQAAGKEFTIDAKTDGMVIDGEPAVLEVIQRQGQLLTVRLGNKTYTVFCKARSGGRFDVWINDHVIPVAIEDQIGKLLATYQKNVSQQSSRYEIKAPMPGLVTSIAVEVGQTVEKEMKLAGLEAMKMENEIRSPIHGVVKKIEVAKGAKVEKEQRLMVLEIV